MSPDQIKKEMAKFLKLAQDRLNDDEKLSDLVSESLILVEMVIHLQEVLKVRLVQQDLQPVQNVEILCVSFLLKPEIKFA